MFRKHHDISSIAIFFHDEMFTVDEILSIAHPLSVYVYYSVNHNTAVTKPLKTQF